jgi:teichuronic acid exporter
LDDNLRQKTISGFIWSAIERIGQQSLYFVLTIIIARILSPEDYGLIGMMAVFISLATSFIDSGFSQALIQKKNVTEEEYSTVFYFNLFISIVAGALLFFTAPFIACFYHEPKLVLVARVMSLNFIVNALGLVQNTKLTKEIEFKSLTKVSIYATIFSGIIGVVMAYSGFGVWTLVFQVLINNIAKTVLLWILSKWKPIRIFNMSALKELFHFGSRMLSVAILNTFFENIYNMLIGKFYSKKDLGYYSQAYKIQQLPVSSLTSMIQKVTFPSYSQIQDDTERLKAAYRKTIAITVFISFPLLVYLMMAAKPLVSLLLTDKWLPSVIYLQLFCLIGLIYPVSAINLNLLMVKGRPGIFLKLEIFKKILIIAAILLTINHGILALVYGQLVITAIAFFLNLYFPGKLINYSLIEQLKDILPYGIIVVIMAFVCYMIEHYFKGDLLKIGLELFFGGFIYVILSKLFNLSAYTESYRIIKTYYDKFRMNKNNL